MNELEAVDPFPQRSLYKLRNGVMHPDELICSFSTGKPTDIDLKEYRECLENLHLDYANQGNMLKILDSLKTIKRFMGQIMPDFENEEEETEPLIWPHDVERIYELAYNPNPIPKRSPRSYRNTYYTLISMARRTLAKLFVCDEEAHPHIWEILQQKGCDTHVKESPDDEYCVRSLSWYMFNRPDRRDEILSLPTINFIAETLEKFDPRDVFHPLACDLRSFGILSRMLCQGPFEDEDQFQKVARLIHAMSVIQKYCDIDAKCQYISAYRFFVKTRPEAALFLLNETAVMSTFVVDEMHEKFDCLVSLLLYDLVRIDCDIAQSVIEQNGWTIVLMIIGTDEVHRYQTSVAERAALVARYLVKAAPDIFLTSDVGTQKHSRKMYQHVAYIASSAEFAIKRHLYLAILDALTLANVEQFTCLLEDEEFITEYLPDIFSWGQSGQHLLMVGRTLMRMLSLGDANEDCREAVESVMFNMDEYVQNVEQYIAENEEMEEVEELSRIRDTIVEFVSQE